MSDNPERRALLQAAAGIAIAQVAPDGTAAPASAGAARDFDFLAGQWNIKHRRLQEAKWDTFEGEATCWTVLGGAASIEELRIPARKFSGLGIRLLDVKQRVWCDYWVNARDGILTPPPSTGVFTNGVGTFTADDVDGKQPIKVRGVWDRITASSCRWHQATSRDGGKTWQENWFMDWQRA